VHFVWGAHILPDLSPPRGSLTVPEEFSFSLDFFNDIIFSQNIGAAKHSTECSTNTETCGPNMPRALAEKLWKKFIIDLNPYKNIFT
jgi:hypothetical protein